jgi:hypothetical protein
MTEHPTDGASDGPCVLECITYHEGSRRMKERKFHGPFVNFLAAHEVMTEFVKAGKYDDILIQMLHPKSEPADASTNPA